MRNPWLWFSFDGSRWWKWSRRRVRYYNVKIFPVIDVILQLTSRDIWKCTCDAVNSPRINSVISYSSSCRSAHRSNAFSRWISWSASACCILAFLHNTPDTRDTWHGTHETSDTTFSWHWQHTSWTQCALCVIRHTVHINNCGHRVCQEAQSTSSNVFPSKFSHTQMGPCSLFVPACIKHAIVNKHISLLISSSSLWIAFHPLPGYPGSWFRHATLF